MFSHIFIIHRAIDTERDISNLLKLDCKHIEVIEPEPIKEDTSQLICMWSKKQKHRQAVISLYETNIKLLKRIIKEGLNRVLILEDDAVIIEPNMETNESSWLNFLNVRIWNNRNVSCLANYYPSYVSTKDLLDKLIFYRKLKKNRHRAFDIELDYMAKKYRLDFSYYNYFDHPINKSTLGNGKYNIQYTHI